MSLKLILAVSLLPHVVFGAPGHSMLAPYPFCEVNAAIISELKQDHVVLPYCQRYWPIHTGDIITVTQTQTPSPVYVTQTITATGTYDTVTVTTTKAATVGATTTVTTTKTATEYVTSTTSTSTLTCLNSAFTAASPTTAAPSPIKRDANHKDKPSCFPDYWPPASISRACHCLSPPAPCTTVTTTQTLLAWTKTVTTTSVIDLVTTTTETVLSTSTNLVSQTATASTTITVTDYVVATAVAANTIPYRKFTHAFNANLANSGFTSTSFKTLKPDFTGAIASLGFGTPNWPKGPSTDISLSDGHKFEASQAAIPFQGFFLAKETGQYIFSSDANTIDNWGYFWLGDAAYGGWDDMNTAFKSSRTGSGYLGGSFPFNLHAGDAVPIAWLWANGGASGQSGFTVTTPSGRLLSDTTGYFVQPCTSDIFH